MDERRRDSSIAVPFSPSLSVSVSLFLNEWVLRSISGTRMMMPSGLLRDKSMITR